MFVGDNYDPFFSDKISFIQFLIDYVFKDNTVLNDSRAYYCYIMVCHCL